MTDATHFRNVWKLCHACDGLTATLWADKAISPAEFLRNQLASGIRGLVCGSIFLQSTQKITTELHEISVIIHILIIVFSDSVLDHI